MLRLDNSTDSFCSGLLSCSSAKVIVRSSAGSTLELFSSYESNGSLYQLLGIQCTSVYIYHHLVLH